MSGFISSEDVSGSTPNRSEAPRSTSWCHRLRVKRGHSVTTRPDTERTTVLLADDHAILLEGLSSLLRSEFAVVGTVADGERLLESARQLRPDVIVTDITMPGMNGLEVLRRLKADTVPVKVIVLTMHAEAQLAADAMRAGASGFIVKHAAGRELIAAIRTVVRGERYIAPQLASNVLAALAEGRTSEGGPLTTRQREVVSLIAEGRTMKEV